MKEELQATYCEKSEKALLGILLNNEQLLEDQRAELPRPLCFGDSRCKEVFSLINDLVSEGKGLDSVTLVNAASDKGGLINCGGAAFIDDLFDSDVPHQNWKQFSDRIKEFHKRRVLYEGCEEFKQKALDPNISVDSLGKLLQTTGATVTSLTQEKKEWLRFRSPNELIEWKSPENYVLVGNSQIQRGAVSILGGPPGSGKSRATMALAYCGATKTSWFGLNVARTFKTMIIQNENGPMRLKDEVSSFVDGHHKSMRDLLNHSILITDPPEFGMAFEDEGFRFYLKKCINEFAPDLIVLDPWNSIARDDAIKGYRESYDNIRKVIPNTQESAALLIVAHTRKPKADKRVRGRDLLNELSGSYLLGSVARCVMGITPFSSDMSDDRVVFETCKNNDGLSDPRSCWLRRNGPFEPCLNVDWEQYDNPEDSSQLGRKQFDSGLLADLIPAEGIRTKDWEQLAKDQYGISESSFYRHMKRLGDEVVCDPITKKYHQTNVQECPAKTLSPLS